MIFLKNKKKCLNCIFFCKSRRGDDSIEYIHSIREIDRDKIENLNEIPIKEDSSYMCFKGVWDCGVAPSLDRDLLKILKKERKKRKCFFVKYSKGMMLKTADELLRIEREHKYQIHTRVISCIGVLISIIGITIAYYK